MAGEPEDPIVILAVDPGPIPGLAMLSYSGPEPLYAQALQCSANWLVELLDAEISQVRSWGRPVILSVEKYSLARRGRLASPGANDKTAAMAGHLIEHYGYLARKLAGKVHGQRLESASLRVVSHSASEVSAWASEKRLRAAGLWDITTGSAHARSAARHALYAACKDGGQPDPLSRKATTPTT